MQFICDHKNGRKRCLLIPATLAKESLVCQAADGEEIVIPYSWKLVRRVINHYQDRRLKYNFYSICPVVKWLGMPDYLQVLIDHYADSLLDRFEEERFSRLSQDIQPAVVLSLRRYWHYVNNPSAKQLIAVTALPVTAQVLEDSWTFSWEGGQVVMEIPGVTQEFQLPNQNVWNFRTGSISPNRRWITVLLFPAEMAVWQGRKGYSLLVDIVDRTYRRFSHTMSLRCLDGYLEGSFIDWCGYAPLGCGSYLVPFDSFTDDLSTDLTDRYRICCSTEGEGVSFAGMNEDGDLILKDPLNESLSLVLTPIQSIDDLVYAVRLPIGALRQDGDRIIPVY